LAGDGLGPGRRELASRPACGAPIFRFWAVTWAFVVGEAPASTKRPTPDN
jgi:hypothetical protein